MTNSYNAQAQLKLLKQQSSDIQKMLFNFRHKDYININKKLANCCHASIIINNRINQQFQSCDSIFCPICASTHKIRRESAIAYGVIDKINNGVVLENGRKTMPILYFLTLTVPKVSVNQFDYVFKQLKANYKTFLKTKMEKASGKLVTFNQSLLGRSDYYHISLNDDCYGNPLVGVHLHAILMLNPSFSGANSIIKKMVKDYWMSINGSSSILQTNIKPLPSTRHDFKNNHAYNLAKLDFDSIIANPSKFIALLPCIQGKRFNTHTGLIRQYRKEVREEYKIEQEIKHQAQMQLEIAKRIDAYIAIPSI